MLTAVYVRSDGAQLARLTARLDSHRLSMPTPRSRSLDQAASALDAGALRIRQARVDVNGCDTIVASHSCKWLASARLQDGAS